MKHWSYYVRVGAVRLSYGASSNNNLRHAAFKNPDGTIILVIQNNSSATVTPLIQIGTKEFKPALAASSVNSFNIGGTEPARDWVPATSVSYIPPKKTSAPKRGPVGIYDIKGRLIKTVEHAAIRENAGSALWNRTDAGHRKAAPGMYLIMNRASNTIVGKVMCQ